MINSILDKALDGFDKVPNPIRDYKEGSKGGKLDLYGTGPIDEFVLYITTSPIGGTVAYNPADFGNYLTGQALNQLGYEVNDIRAAAHINNILNGPSDHGSRERSGWLDSAEDQRAITNGYYHFQQFYHWKR